jgi:hypothetical protein
LQSLVVIVDAQRPTFILETGCRSSVNVLVLGEFSRADISVRSPTFTRNSGPSNRFNLILHIAQGQSLKIIRPRLHHSPTRRQYCVVLGATRRRYAHLFRLEKPGMPLLDVNAFE